MKRLMSLLLVAVMSFGMFGCSKTAEETTVEPNVVTSKKVELDLDELKKNEGEMLVFTSHYAGECTQEEYEASFYSVSVTYSGVVYNPNPFSDGHTIMSDSDLKSLYDFCIDAYENDTFKYYGEDTCDGTVYKFVYFDLDGNAHTLYSGHCDNNEALKKAHETITNYAIG